MGRIVDICFDVMEKKKTNNTPCSSAYGISNIADRIPTFKAVLFDMDGVLYNSMPNHAVAWVRAMKDFGMHFTPEDSYATEGARGVDTIRVFAKKQLGKDLTEEEAQKIYDVKTRYFHELPVAPIFDGVVDLMRKIKSAGLQICIVTGSGQRPLFKRLVDDFGEFIDENHIVTAYDVKRGKPNPDPYLMGLKKCGPPRASLSRMHRWEYVQVWLPAAVPWLSTQDRCPTRYCLLSTPTHFSLRLGS